MPHCFTWNFRTTPVNCLCGAASLVQQAATKDLTGEPFDPHYFIGRGRKSVRFEKESRMAWKAPKIVEVSVGMEINMYTCATRK